MKKTLVIRDEGLAKRASDIIATLVPRSESDTLHEVVVREHKSSRSLAQNNILHAWMMEVATQYAEGYGQFHSPAKWKLFFKEMFLGSEAILLPQGKVSNRLRSTADLKVKEFAEFLDNIDHYAGSELHIFLSRPEDYGRAMGRAA